MEIVQTAQPIRFRLRESFLSNYSQRDPFKTLLGRATYLSKYSRNGESWSDTIRRVVEGNLSLAPGATEREGELLYHLFWTGQALPPGRGLWVGGVDGIPADARYNCWYTTLYGIDDWCWVMNQLMLGGGVGVGLSDIESMPHVADNHARFAIWCKSEHPDLPEVQPNDKNFLNGQTPIFVVSDSRQGWVEAERRTLAAAFEGHDLIVDVSAVRRRGLPIRTFGGTACGPGPLSNLLRSSWSIVRGAKGRKLSSIECLDITNMIGFCVKSGNVRRSALIVLGDPEDQPFRDAKKDLDKVLSHRHTSNNSIVFRTWEQIEKFDWHKLIEDNINFGEPGLFNLPLVWKTDPGVKGINPCLTGDTRISTQFGMVQIAELARMGKSLRVTTDRRVQRDYQVSSDTGIEFRDAVAAFRVSDRAEVFRLRTRHGIELKITADHEFPTPTGFVKLQDLQVGDDLLLQSGEGQWGSEGSEAIGTVIGCIEGDGNFCLGEDNAYLGFWGEQKPLAEVMLPLCLEIASISDPLNGHKTRFGVKYSTDKDKAQIDSPLLGRALAEYGYREKGHVPEIVWRGTRDCVRGYLRGFFVTDGQINWSLKKQCFSFRLSQSNPGLLREVQTLLLNFGIVSTIYKRRDAQWRRMPDGKGGMKDYWNQTQYDLVISKQNAVVFAENVGFLWETHSRQYAAWADSWVRGPYREAYLTEIVSIESIGFEPVYCTTQPTHHTFIAEGLVSGNCGELPLYDREACNLAEAFPALFSGARISAEHIFRLLTRYTLRQKLTSLTDEKSDRVNRRNMRLGVALGGICDFDWTPEDLSTWYGYCRSEANRYADELRVPRPIKVTTVKPSGTISLLNDSSPGIHAPFSEYYLRRARLSSNDLLIPALVEAGVPMEYDQYDKTGHTVVFAFPTKAVHTRVTVQSQTIRDQFERQCIVQEHWADNSVSATLSFNAETEREAVTQCLKDYVPRLKSTTVLSTSHGYPQAPYEAIDELTYRRLHSAIRHEHPLPRGGNLEIEECASGVCPIK